MQSKGIILINDELSAILCTDCTRGSNSSFSHNMLDCVITQNDFYLVAWHSTYTKTDDPETTCRESKLNSVIGTALIIFILYIKI